MFRFSSTASFLLGKLNELVLFLEERGEIKSKKFLVIFKSTVKN